MAVEWRGVCRVCGRPESRRDRRVQRGAGPDPGRAEVAWRTPDGRDHQQQVEVAGRIPNLAAFSGTIFFKITDGGVQLVPLTNNERDRLAEERKPYP